MGSPSDTNTEKSMPHEHLANELGNLRNHFSPVSSSGMGRSSVDTLGDRRSPLALDNALVQKTKDQIRVVVENIAELAHAPISPHDFVTAVLPKIASAMGAIGAAFWQQLPDSNWRLIGHFNLPSSLLDASENENAKPYALDESSTFEQLDFLESQLGKATQSTTLEDEASEGNSKLQQPSASHESVLNAVARERQPILIPPCEALLNRDRPANPTSELLIYAPLLIQNEHGSYWLQIVQSPSGGPASQRGYLRFVAQMADLMSDYFRSHRLRVFERDRGYLTLAEQTMNDLAIGLDPKLGVAKLLKIIREHAHSEHAFLVRRESRLRKWRLVGAAGLVDVDRRADGIGQIERVSSTFDAMFRNGGAMNVSHLPAGVDERDPDLTRLFNTFAISDLQWIKPLIAVVSNSTNGALQKANQAKLALTPSKQDVAILLTWSGIDKPPARCFEQCGLIARLGLSALEIAWWKNALQANQGRKRSPWSFANPATWPRAAKWCTSLAMLSVLFALPVPIRLHATAVLVPLVQQHVYAPMDATVEAVLVEHGQSVKLGDLLIRLKSPSLTSEYEQTVAMQLRNSQRLEDIESRLLRGTSLSSQQQDELEGERKSILSIRPFESKELARLRKQVDSLMIVATVDGVVSTWNIQDSLKDRPLRTGQWLLSLHESDSTWVLEAELPERDANELRLAMDHHQNTPVATMTGMPQIQLPVHMRHGSLPRVESLPQGEFLSDPNAAVIRLRFEVDADSLPRQVAVAGATARISIPVGRGPLIWALGKDFVHKVWSRVQLWI